MVIGYKEGVNKIVIITTEGKKMTRHLAIKGLNVIWTDNGYDNYTYYNKEDGLLHYLDMKYIEVLKLYKDKELIMEVRK